MYSRDRLLKITDLYINKIGITDYKITKDYTCTGISYRASIRDYSHVADPSLYACMYICYVYCLFMPACYDTGQVPYLASAVISSYNMYCGYPNLATHSKWLRPVIIGDYWW